MTGLPKVPSFLAAEFLPGCWPPDPSRAWAAVEQSGWAGGRQHRSPTSWAGGEEETSSSVPWTQATPWDLYLSALHFNSINETSGDFLLGEGAILL